MTKIEKLLEQLDKCMNVMRKADFTAVPGDRGIWRILDDLRQDCNRDVRKFGPESLLEDDEYCPGHDQFTDCEIDPQDPCDACNAAEDARLERELYDRMTIDDNPDPHLRGLP